MLRRTLLQMALVGLGTAWLSACSTPVTPEEKATARQEIDGAILPTLNQLYTQSPGSRELADKAVGLLVFPSILKVGVGIGGEYGKGALRVGGQSTGYYSLGSGSLGVQLGAERRSVVFMFMTQQALENFQKSSGWTGGADASLASPESGLGGLASTAAPRSQVVVFVFGNSGLMFNASLAGTRVTRLDL